ncbi:putative protein OS=Streptomyces violarus OX=67380 GN=FHS41_006659 PE=4 SV=1 [Streptomyces violarus]
MDEAVELQERKACYAAFNAAGRHYLATLSDHAHVLRHGAEDPRESLAEVDAARAEYGRQYAEAQMVVPDTVLAELRTVNAALGSVYGCLARLTRGTPREGDDIDAVRSEVRRVWQFLTRMRATMRADLDVTGPSHGSPRLRRQGARAGSRSRMRTRPRRSPALSAAS